jgi:ribosome maturation factor RimP
LDVDDPIAGAYNLEVCSPGIDRPLTKPGDFVRYSGYEVKCETMLPVEGRKRFRGIMHSADGKVVSFTMPEGEKKELTFGNIRSAKLVMTDELVADTLKKSKK